ncbi:NAD(P)/FAD-dependent oxidoreductase [Streptosporangium algeriense]|uniref:NAD(P)/FAD-dependent oxidoreductase n=1 Tax=Streptosporangium algeriense TaxID=1682748 RepID=A0ABW3DPK8_9ACTN
MTGPHENTADRPAERTRVLVIGGGPGGSTAAALLARQGIEVTLLESAVFPRYHIGESILPSVLPILDLLGIREKIEKHGFVRKDGAYFEWGPENWDLNFDHLSGANRYSYQVIRSEFDHLLLEHARSQGVRVREATKVTEILFEGERPVAARWVSAGDRSETGRIDFDFLVDASGRAGVMATKYLRNRRYHEAFKNIAVWSYWRDVKPLDRGPQGAIAVCSVPYGWFWAIPLHDGTTSVGLVAKRSTFVEERERLGGIEAVYRDALGQCPRIAVMVENATKVSDFKVEQDYSYVSDRKSGPGYVLVGDAACFLDPLLSTGVHLSTFSALLGAASISAVLDGELSEEEAMNFYEKAYHQAYERLLVVVSFFYKSYNRQSQFFEADKLTRRERHMLHLYESFLHIVTGIEDLDDSTAGEEALESVAERIVQQQRITAGHNEALNSMPTSPREAVGGLYLELEPKLRIRRAAPSAPAPGVTG